MELKTHGVPEWISQSNQSAFPLSQEREFPDITAITPDHFNLKLFQMFTLAR